MKRIFIMLLALTAWLPTVGQNMNPQPNFSTQIYSAQPSLYLNFNDMTSAFKEQVSGNTFANSWTYTVNHPGGTTGNLPTPTITPSTSAVVMDGVPLQVGPLASISVQYRAVPIAGPVAIWIGCGTLPSLTYLTSFNVNISATTSVQTFAPLTNYSPVTIAAANCYGGTWSKTNTGPDCGAYVSGNPLWYVNGQATLPTGAIYLTSYTGCTLDYQATTLPSAVSTPYTSGSVAPRQPGFDSTQINNSSAAFAYNGFSVAPNNTLGAIEWNTPWTMLAHIDRLNWNRTGTLVLASKGDSSSSSNSWWKLTLGMSGLQSQLCFTRNGMGSSSAWQGVCTGYFDAMPNGFNYDIVITDSGTGNSGVAGQTNIATPALTLYINGLTNPYISTRPFTGSYSGGFGAVTLTATGGTGYAASTAFTSTGGGANCNVGGTIAASSGVMQVVSLTYDYGCTSIPAIVLTSSTGVGATITPVLGGALMNSSALPLMVPGYVSANATYGIDNADATQTATNIDEFAIFPGVLSQTQIQSLFYQTKFWQGVVKTQPGTPYTVVVDEDACGDEDNIFAVALAIAAERIGYIRLAGIVDTDGSGTSEAIYRQMLDQAGLAHIPMAVPSSFTVNSGATGFCNATNVSTYNASTPTISAAYPQAKTMYRQVFAANPTTPVFIMLGGSFRGVADLMQSTADSVSSLTGAQLIAQNAANGGAIYAQGLGANISFSGDNSLADWTAGQYVVAHNGAMPIYWYGGQPMITGPGVLSTRTSKDPFYLAANWLGADTRQGYDSLPTQGFLSTLFTGGVNVAITGSGSGYAVSTPFTSTGGGANCVVSGYMLSTSGVPSSIVSTGGAAGTGTYDGVGSGCLTAATPPIIVLTAPSGTGVVLTATTTASGCETVAITGATAGTTTSATCSNHYFLPFSINASSSPVSGAVMEWFINSLVDPVTGGAPRAR